MSLQKFGEGFKGQVFHGWRVGEYLGEGKSAVVMTCSKENEVGAIKIFDPRIVERFGAEVQEERINREVSLKGKVHRNLVNIYEGGKTKDEIYFIIMEKVTGISLADVISERINKEDAWNIVCEVAEAAKFLEENGICHRDIKPDNIMVDSSFKNAKLLDLGVVKPLEDAPDITDQDAKEFVGTLRYSPQELLFREEGDTVEDWRAITFYQLAATFYDLHAGQRIYKDDEKPYPRLVEAIRHKTLKVSSEGLPPKVVNIVNNSLIKDAKLRVQLVSWSDYTPDSFQEDSSVIEIKQRIRKKQRVSSHQETQNDMRCFNRDAFIRLSELRDSLVSFCRNEYTAEPKYFPSFTFLDEGINPEDPETEFRFNFSKSARFAVEKDFCIGFKVCLIDPEEDVVKIDAFGSCEGCEPIDERLFIGAYSEAGIQSKIKMFSYKILELSQG